MFLVPFLSVLCNTTDSVLTMARYDKSSRDYHIIFWASREVCSISQHLNRNLLDSHCILTVHSVLKTERNLPTEIQNVAGNMDFTQIS